MQSIYSLKTTCTYDQDLSDFGGDWVAFFGFLSYFNVFLLLFWIFTALHNAYFEQLKFLAVVCAQTMPKKISKNI